MAAAPLKRCLVCDYALNGLIDARCPECGLEFNPEDETSYGLDPDVSLRACVFATIVGAAGPIFLLLGLFLRPTVVSLVLVGVGTILAMPLGWLFSLRAFGQCGKALRRRGRPARAVFLALLLSNLLSIAAAFLCVIFLLLVGALPSLR